MLLMLLAIVTSIFGIYAGIMSMINEIAYLFWEKVLAVILYEIEKRRLARKGIEEKRSNKIIMRKIFVLFALSIFAPLWLSVVMLYTPIWLYKLIKRRRAK